MNCYDGIHWNIYDILPYQRNFNLICSVRDLGKTYTVQKYVLDKCIERGQQFVYILRTDSEREKGMFWGAFEKVCDKEFSCKFECDKTTMYWLKEIEPERTITDNNGNTKLLKPEYVKILLGHCVTLSEVYKVKKVSRPYVKYMIFDEYIIEDESRSSYVGGYKEPNRLLTLYETIDRLEDRVVVFMLSNSLKFYNPYHIHKSFPVKNIGPGEIWMNKNVLYQRPIMSDALRKIKSESKFADMIAGTQYGDMSVHGEFIQDNFSFIGTRGRKSSYKFTVVSNGTNYGVWINHEEKYVVISYMWNPQYPLRLALSTYDHNELTMMAGRGKSPHLKWLAKQYSYGYLKFENMKIKTELEDQILNFC